MNTTENNKLLAYFLGYTQPHPDYKDASYWYKENEAPLTILSFNYDWNWLMLVVEKIESLENHKFWFESRQNLVTIYDREEDVDIIEMSNDNKKILTYNACVEFVKFYNGR